MADENDFLRMLQEWEHDVHQSFEVSRQIEDGLLPPVPEADCRHTLIKGDNYGTTCSLCLKVLTGYGYNAHANECAHGSLYPVKGGKACSFCEKFFPD